MTLTLELPVVNSVWLAVYGFFGVLAPIALSMLVVSDTHKRAGPGFNLKQILTGALLVVPLYLAYCYLINIKIEPLMEPYVAGWGGYVVGPSRQEEGRHMMKHLLRGLAVIGVLAINIPCMVIFLTGFVRDKE